MGFQLLSALNRDISDRDAKILLQHQISSTLVDASATSPVSLPSPVISNTQWICLTGFMGCGKSTVGASLARLLGWRFVDLDTEIVEQQGRSIAEIFSSHGEPRFRRIESETLIEVLKTTAKPAVIALGGGTFIQSGNREALGAEKALTVYLEGDFDLLLTRCCAEGGTRPLMRDRAQFRRLFDERQPIYRSAEVVVQIAGRSPDQIAVEIAAAVQGWKAKPAVPE